MAGLNMQAPAPYAQFQAQSGTSYTASSSGVINNVAVNDIVSLVNGGCLPISFSTTDGISPRNLPLIDFKLATGLQLAATASAGALGLSVTEGTAVKLVGEAATGATKADAATTVINLPNTYATGSNFNVVLNANYTGTGTNNASNASVAAYRQSSTGVSTALTVSAAQNISGTAADYTFTVTGTPCLPGDAIWIVTSLSVVESGGTNALTGQINSARLA